MFAQHCWEKTVLCDEDWRRSRRAVQAEHVVCVQLAAFDLRDVDEAAVGGVGAHGSAKRGSVAMLVHKVPGGSYP